MPKPVPAYLLIDLSNSFTKFAAASRDCLKRVSRIPTSALTRRALEGMARPGQKIVLSSVVPEKTRLVLKAFAPQVRRGDFVNVTSRLNIGAGIGGHPYLLTPA